MTSSVLDLIVIRCRDLERSRAFYAALGLDLVPEQHGTGPHHYSCTFGPLVLELYPCGTHPPTTGVRLGLRVADTGASVAAVVALGVGRVLRAADDKAALLQDPDANVVHLTAVSS